MNDQEVLVMLTPRVIRLPEPGLTEGTAVPMGSHGGEERPGMIEGARPFEVPNPEAR